MENPTVHFQLEKQQSKHVFFLTQVLLLIIYSQQMELKAVEATFDKMGQI